MTASPTGFAESTGSAMTLTSQSVAGGRTMFEFTGVSAAEAENLQMLLHRSGHDHVEAGHDPARQTNYIRCWTRGPQSPRRVTKSELMRKVAQRMNVPCVDLPLAQP